MFREQVAARITAIPTIVGVFPRFDLAATYFSCNSPDEGYAAMKGG
jgi:hypothetical protein